MNKISIVDWFNPADINHLKAYEHLMNKGSWPVGFIDEDTIDFPRLWQYSITSSIADYYVSKFLYG